MDLRSEFAISVLDLPKKAGTEKEYSYTFATPADFGLELIGIPEGSDLDVDLRFQTVSEGIFVQGNVSATAVGKCSRCLKEIVTPVDEMVAELVFWPEKRQALIDEGDEEAEEMPVVEDEHIDLEPILRDAVVLSLPFTPVCKPDCQGLCPDCGERFEDLPEDHEHEVLNPAFSALDALAAQFEAEEVAEADAESDDADAK